MKEKEEIETYFYKKERVRNAEFKKITYELITLEDVLYTINKINRLREKFLSEIKSCSPERCEAYHEYLYPYVDQLWGYYQLLEEDMIGLSHGDLRYILNSIYISFGNPEIKTLIDLDVINVFAKEIKANRKKRNKKESVK